MKGLVLLLAIPLIACQHRPAKPQIEIVIPKGCITSEVVCTEVGGHKMDCKFDKFTGCEVIRPIPK